MYIFSKICSLISPDFELRNSKSLYSLYCMPGTLLISLHKLTQLIFPIIPWCISPILHKKKSWDSGRWSNLSKATPIPSDSKIWTHSGSKSHTQACHAVFQTVRSPMFIALHWTLTYPRWADPLTLRPFSTEDEGLTLLPEDVMLAKPPWDSRKSLRLVPAAHR